MHNSDKEPVTSTSWWMAAIRAQESARDDAYLIDPYAQLLATEAGADQAAALADLGAPNGAVILRGRFGDHALVEAVADGLRQGVALGAGSDTRGYRMELPDDFVLFEVDLPGQLAAKHLVLSEAGLVPACRISPVETDLRGDWYAALAAAGFSPARPSVWLAEGLFYYLDHDTATTLLDQVGAHSAPGSVLLLDVPDETYPAGHAAFLDYMAARGHPFVGFTSDPTAWLTGLGWQAEAYLPDRLPGAPARLVDSCGPVWFVRATRK